jgi:hypothetical protein
LHFTTIQPLLKKLTKADQTAASVPKPLARLPNPVCEMHRMEACNFVVICSQWCGTFHKWKQPAEPGIETEPITRFVK